MIPADLQKLSLTMAVIRLVVVFKIWPFFVSSRSRFRKSESFELSNISQLFKGKSSLGFSFLIIPITLISNLNCLLNTRFKISQIRYFRFPFAPVSQSNTEIYQIIFDYEKDMKFRPIIETGTARLVSGNTEFSDFLVEWDEMRTKHYNGEISDQEFDDWKLSYPKKSRFLRKWLWKRRWN